VIKCLANKHKGITTQINQAKNNCVQPVTPVCHKTLVLLLQNYDSGKANYLVCGFNNGFRIDFQGDRYFRASPNLKSASEFLEIVEEKLAIEISQGRIADPFHELRFVNMHISPIGVVPKKEVGQYRLIHHLSYPTDKSINEHIADELKTVHYSSMDDAIEIILNLSPNVTKAKTEISNAFRIIPIHPHDHEFYVSSLMAAFTSINVYPWDAQVLARYLKNVHVHFNGFLTVANCLFIYYHLITFILASLITYDKLEKSIQVGI
jgi:hypothetical protein